MRRQRGHILVQLLVISSLLFVLASSFVAMASFHSYTVSRRTELYRARLAGQAAIEEAMVHLTQDATWQGSVQGETLNGSYRLSFDDSVNNLKGPLPLQGYAGRLVPPNSALLVGHGNARSEASSTVLALVRFEPYPFALAASNGLTAASRLRVLGALSLEDVAAGRLDEPAGILMAAPGSNLTAGPGSLVTGGIQVSSGDPILGPGSDVRQGVRQGAVPSMLPDLDLARYDNQGFEGLTELLPGSYPSTALEGPVRVPGTLQLAGAALQNAYVYVDGDLAINGRLSGNGSFYVRGNARLRGNQSLVGGTSIAVFSQGTLEVAGASFFQGLLYSHEFVRTGAGMNVVGSVIVQAPSGLPQGGRIELGANSTVVYVPELAGMGAAGSELRVSYWSYLP